MSAIATTILAFVRPGDVILRSQPLNGGTETFLRRDAGASVHGAVGFSNGVDQAAVSLAAQEASAKGRVAMISLKLRPSIRVFCEVSNIEQRDRWRRFHTG